MSEQGIDYPTWVQEALISVVRRALAHAAEHGLDGEHHFYLTFATRAPGVALAPHLRDLHPDKLTVVLQHQFWDLAVDDERFAVTLSFGGRRERLVVPYGALTSFVDPAAEFGLQLGPRAAAAAIAPPGESDAASAATSATSATSSGSVVPFDRPRKR